MEHTEGKWEVCRPLDMEGMRHSFIDSKEGKIGRIDGYFEKNGETRHPTAEQATANAQRIVQCVNNFDEVCDALQSLYDEQNGPPLIRDEERWQEAMDKSSKALKKQAVNSQLD